MRTVLLILPLLLAGCAAESRFDAAFAEQDATVAEVVEGVATDLDRGKLKMADVGRELPKRLNGRGESLWADVLAPMEDVETEDDVSGLLREIAAARRRKDGSREEQFYMLIVGALIGTIGTGIFLRKHPVPTAQQPGAKP